MPLDALASLTAPTMGATGGVAVGVAALVGVAAALLISEYMPLRARRIARPVVEVAAGLPLVLLGLIALAVAPSAPAAPVLLSGGILGLLLAPHLCAAVLTEVSAVPARLRAGSAGLGASRAQTIRHILLPATRGGILAAVLSSAARGLAEAVPFAMLVALARHGTAHTGWSAATDPEAAEAMAAVAAAVLVGVAALRAAAIALRGQGAGTGGAA